MTVLKNDIFENKILEKSVLDKGFVKIIDMMPRLVPEGYSADYVVVEAARVSTQKGLKTVEEDKKLLNYLYKNKHDSCFEQAQLKFHIKCPIFIARQWMRHRSGSFNEISGRYSQLKNEYYIPDKFYKQNKINKQGSSEVIDDEHINTECTISFKDICEKAFAEYEFMLESISREQARMILPLNTYTEFIWSVNLRNLLHFLTLRMDTHAQLEMQNYANAIFDLITQFFPWTIEAYNVRSI